MDQTVYLGSAEEPKRHWDCQLRDPGREKYTPDAVLHTNKCALYGPAEGPRALGTIYL